MLGPSLFLVLLAVGIAAGTLSTWMPLHGWVAVTLPLVPVAGLACAVVFC